MKPILLDTHAAIWGAAGTLRARLAGIIDAASERGELFLSPISAWEIGTLVRKGRLRLGVDLHEYLRSLFGPGITTALLTPAIAGAAAELADRLGGDPADRIIVATAQAYGAQLVTRDEAIHAYARSTRSLRCIIC